MRKGTILTIIFLFITFFPSGNRYFLLFSTKKGDYVTCYTETLTNRLNWISKFKMVEVGGVDDPPSIREIERLKESGVEGILFYDWFPAGYHYIDGEEDNLLMSWVFSNRSFASLNPEGPFPHCKEEGYSWCEDYYFDFGFKEVIEKKINFLMSFKKEFGYDGVFFDWASGRFIEEEEYDSIRETFNIKHPDKTYLDSVGEFYQTLREKSDDMIIVTNQGFRNKNNVLRWVDYDMTESYGTDYGYFGKVLYVEGMGFVEVPQTIYYPVSDSVTTGSLKDTLYYLDFLNSLRAKFEEPFKNFICMNYAAPDFIPLDRKNGITVYKPKIPKNAIFFGYALSKLYNFISYTEVPFDNSLEESNIYFYDLGKPLGERYENIDGGYIRYYTNGFVVVGEWQSEVSLSLNSPYIKEGVPVYDLFNERWAGTTKNHAITIHISPVRDELTDRMAPSGRVYLYPSFTFIPQVLLPMEVKNSIS